MFSEALDIEIKKFIFDKLTTSERVIAKDVVDIFLQKTELKEMQFRLKLGKLVEEDEKLISKRGRFGGIFLNKVDNQEKMEKKDEEIVTEQKEPSVDLSIYLTADKVEDKAEDITELEEPLVPKVNYSLSKISQPAVKPAQHLPKMLENAKERIIFINGKKYTVNISDYGINTLLREVINAKENENGNIVLDGKKFLADDNSTEIFRRFLYELLEALLGVGRAEMK